MSDKQTTATVQVGTEFITYKANPGRTEPIHDENWSKS